MGCLVGPVLSRHLPPVWSPSLSAAPGRSRRSEAWGPQKALPTGRRLLGQTTGHWVLENRSWKLRSTSGKGSTCWLVSAAKPLYSRSFLLSIKEADHSVLPSSSLAGKRPPALSPKLQAGRSLVGEGSRTWPHPQPLLPTGKSAKAQALPAPHRPPAPLLQKVTCARCPCPVG